MRCPSCNAQIEVDASFCGACGSRIAASANESGAWIITVGRNGDNTLMIDHPGVSAHHAQLRVEGKAIILEDLNSRNGTYVNGHRILIQNVSHRDQVTFGQSVALDWQEFEKLLASATPVRFAAPAVQSYTPPVPSMPRQVAPAPQAPARGITPEPARPNAYAGLGSEMAFALHANKSFTGKAFLSLFLYYFGFGILGFLSNIIFLSDANRTKRLIGSNPPGYGCLTTLLVVHAVIALAGVIILMAVGLRIYN